MTCFLWPGAMERLRPRFEEQLAPGTRIVSHWHPIPGWSPAAVDRPLHVYLYEWPGRSATMVTAPIDGGSKAVVMEP